MNIDELIRQNERNVSAKRRIDELERRYRGCFVGKSNYDEDSPHMQNLKIFMENKLTQPDSRKESKCQTE